MLSAGEVGQEKGDATPTDFLMPAASGVSPTRSRARDLGLSWKPKRLGVTTAFWLKCRPRTQINNFIIIYDIGGLVN